MKNYDLKSIQVKMLEIAIEFDKFCEENNIRYAICAGSLLGCVRHKGFIPWDDDFDVIMPRNDFDRFLTLWPETHKFALIKNGDENYHKVGSPAKIYDRNTRVSEINELENGMPEFNPYGIFMDVFPSDIYKNSIIDKVINNYLGKLLVAKELSKFDMTNKPFFHRIAFSIIRYIPSIFFTTLKKIVSKHLYRNNYITDLKNSFVGYGYETPFSNLKLAVDKMWPPSKGYFIDGYNFYGPADGVAYLKCRYGDFMKLPPLNQRYQHIVKVIEVKDEIYK